MSTNSLSIKEIKRDWHLIDAKKQVLGRLSTQVAALLMGKTKPQFVNYLDNGDYVVVINASEITLTGKKDLQKMYYRHSGYPGGMKKTKVATMRADKPEEVVIHSIKGMLPKTKLGRAMIKKLHVYAEESHPYANRFAKTEALKGEEK